MSYRPSSGDTPIITNYQPRGRPVLATFGALLVLAGGVVWGLAASGTITLPKVNNITSIIPGNTTPSVSPQGTAPPAFKAYRDPQHQFALFVSSTWQAQDTTLTLSGQSLKATLLTPTGSTLPSWRIAFPSAPLPTDSLSAISAVSGVFTAEGDKNVTPTSGPTSVQVGSDTWSRIDFTLQTAKGVEVHAVSFSRPTSKGAVLVIEEGQSLTFSTTEKQDFTPMLNSLKVEV
jgi:hypothetical protein